MKYTKEEKQEYFKALRAKWKKVKESTDLPAIEKIIATHGLNISPTGFAFVKTQMDSLGLKGLPYLDMKTFKGWLDSGFRVIKGEKSTADGLTWIRAGEGKNDEDPDENTGFVFPKIYKLFHRTQVQEA